MLFLGLSLSLLLSCLLQHLLPHLVHLLLFGFLDSLQVYTFSTGVLRMAVARLIQHMSILVTPLQVVLADDILNLA